MIDTTSTKRASFTVGHWLTTYRVSNRHSAPLQLQSLLDAKLESLFAEEFHRMLDAELDAADESVWRIRELAFDSFARPDLPGDVAARLCCRKFVEKVVAAVHGDSSTEESVRFADYATFLAHFLSDFAAGRAWGKWYFEEFEGIRVLSPSRAIVAVLRREPGQIASVICKLVVDGRLEGVLDSLAESDARDLLDICFDGAPSGSSSQVDTLLGTILEAWSEAPLPAPASGEDHFRDSIRILARLAARSPGVRPSQPVRFLIHWLLQLRRALTSAESPVLVDRIVQRLAAGQIGAAAALVPEDASAESLAALKFFAERMDGDTGWGSQVVAVILNAGVREKAVNCDTLASGESLLSPFGSVFLIAPSFLSLRLDEVAAEAAAACPDLENSSAVLRHIVSIKFMGSGRATQSANDAALRLFSGVDEAVFRRNLESFDARKMDFQAARRSLLRLMAEAGRAEAQVVFADLCVLGTLHALVVVDLQRNEWLDMIPLSDASDAAVALASSLTDLDAALGRKPEWTLLGESLASASDDSALLRLTGRFLTASRENETWLPQIAAEAGVAPRHIANIVSSAQGNAAYLSLSSIFPEIHLPLDCFCSLLAHAALKGFARRLPGFESSSFEYLHERFFAGLATIRSTPDQLRVRMPAGPLSVVMRMAGLFEQRFSLPWWKGREVCLLLHED